MNNQVIKICFVFIIALVTEYASSQYLSLHHKTMTLPNTCYNSSGTLLVEHFFNLIFAEFYNSPPVCVCVQICVDQPTYCYPNNCLTRTANRKKETVTLPILNQDDMKPTFLVPDEKEFLMRFVEADYATERPVKMTEKLLWNEIRPNPFKDRFKSLFKYKKMPKVHLKYNLREQVKNTKSEQIRIEKSDVSKTRWPGKKHLKGKKQFFMESSGNGGKLDETGNFKISPITASSSRYFKRDLNKNRNDNSKTTTDEAKDVNDSPFELENLIEYLIESSFKPVTNDTDQDFNASLNYLMNNVTATESIKSPVETSKKRFIDLLNENATLMINETTKIISMNLTNENTDQNKYFDDSKETYKNVFKEMIDTLSKNIDRQNNSSVEFMNTIFGSIDEEDTTDMTTPEIISKNTTISVQLQNAEITTTDIVESSEMTTTEATEVN